MALSADSLDPLMTAEIAMAILAKVVRALRLPGQAASGGRRP